ncbi:CocE/NonD family hydrolase [Streptomyces albipurpureus]|uniref:CocE/NonD family hydrolase n=1 Tax=Streptomyces albipurpureus TaxID=2897419 RepID=UPI003CE4B842
MRHRRRFPYETSHADVWIPLLANGPHESTMLYARIWRPHTSQPVPALLEYAPDRLGDSTAARDAQRHPWYAGHGYASVRVDARGHGSSAGSPDTSAALPDGLAVIAWLAAQPWCTGRVGAFGLGRGASWALGLGALAPEPLGAVVSVCAAEGAEDSVFCAPPPPRNPGPVSATDGPGSSPLRPVETIRTASASGGASPAATPVPVDVGMAHSRATDLLTARCLPPDPLHTEESWRALWLSRLEAVEPAPPAQVEPAPRPTSGGDRTASKAHRPMPTGPVRPFWPSAAGAPPITTTC